MSIRLLITRGFGNGTFNGDIAHLVTRGFGIGTAIIDPTAAFTLLGAAVLSATFITHDTAMFNMVAYGLMGPDFGDYILMDVMAEDQLPLIDVSEIGQVFAADRVIFTADQSSQVFPTHDAASFNIMAYSMGIIDFGSYFMMEDLFEDQLPLVGASNISGGL